MTTTGTVYVWVSVGAKVSEVDPKRYVGNLHPLEDCKPFGFPADYSPNSFVPNAKVGNLRLLDELDVLCMYTTFAEGLGPRGIVTRVILLWFVQHYGKRQPRHEEIKCTARAISSTKCCRVGSVLFEIATSRRGIRFSILERKRYLHTGSGNKDVVHLEKIFFEEVPRLRYIGCQDK
jgi:hypothetical protein